jgi:oligopeptide transport system permease protein
VQGCDYFALTVESAATSMAVGPLVAVLAALLGGALGAAAGFLGGPVDALLARVTDVWLAVPPLLGGVVILSFVGQRSVVDVAVVLALLSWPPLLRAMRGSVLERREDGYVEAARALGAGRWRLLRRHVAPNALGPVVVAGAVSVGVAVSAEALLSFMGTGISLPDTSWGLLLSVSRDRIAEAPHLLLPGVFLVLLVAAFVLLAEALRDVLDPRTR